MTSPDEDEHLKVKAKVRLYEAAQVAADSDSQ
jgi:hypothetical protein